MLKAFRSDRERTRALQELTEPVDPTCCNACAVHVHAVRSSAFPEGFLEALTEAGVDPLRPREVWGAPDGGFMNGWFLAAGEVAGDNVWAQHGDREFLDVGNGFQIWVGRHITMRPPEVDLDGLVEIEFVWESEQLKELEKVAWPESSGTRGV